MSDNCLLDNIHNFCLWCGYNLFCFGCCCCCCHLCSFGDIFEAKFYNSCLLCCCGDYWEGVYVCYYDRDCDDCITSYSRDNSDFFASFELWFYSSMAPFLICYDWCRIKAFKKQSYDTIYEDEEQVFDRRAKSARK